MVENFMFSASSETTYTSLSTPIASLFFQLVIHLRRLVDFTSLKTREVAYDSESLAPETILVLLGPESFKKLLASFSAR